MQPQFQSAQTQQFQSQQQQVISNSPHAQVNQTSQPQPSTTTKSNVKQQQQPTPPTSTQSKTGRNTQTTNVSSKEPPQVGPKFIELPKIDPNSQQLFSLNTITNQITQLSPGLTTAALGPMERLLIVPAGINAQQLAQCLLQGQIHFNNIGQAAQAPIPTSQQSMQAVQQPLQTVHQSVQPNQQPPLHSTSVGSLPLKKVQPTVESKARKAKPRAKKTEAVKPIQHVVQPMPKNSQVDIKSHNQTNVQKTNISNPPRPPSSSSFQSPSNAAPPIQFNNHHNPSGVQQNVQIVRPSIQQPIASQMARTSVNNNQQVMQTGPSNPGQRMTMTQQRPTAHLQSSQTQIQMNQQHLSNGPNMSAAPMSAVPPLVSVHPIPQQHPAGSQNQQSNQPRVQTIQLTPQKQQLLKNVQMQIQSLSSRLQNKSLLSTLTIPPDFDLNNPVHNKPLPMLSNINAMSDNEIHQALQRLFIEQQKILATGKIIAPITSSQPSFASGPVNIQPSLATAKPAIQYGQAPTSNTLPTKPSAVVPTTTTPKPKPKSRAKASKPVDVSKTTIPMSVAPQITTPTLVNRQATIRITTPSTVASSEKIKSSPSTTAFIQHDNQSYTLQNTNVNSQPQIITHGTTSQVANLPSVPRLSQPSSLTIVPTTANSVSSSIRQQAPSNVSMTLHPAMPKGIVIQQLSQPQTAVQPTQTIQKQPQKLNNVHLKTQNTTVRSPVAVPSALPSGPSLVQQQTGENMSQLSNDHRPPDPSHSQPISQSEPLTHSQIQRPEEHLPDSIQSPATNSQIAHDAPVVHSSPDLQPTPAIEVDQQPPASPKMKVPRHCL